MYIGSHSCKGGERCSVQVPRAGGVDGVGRSVSKVASGVSRATCISRRVDQAVRRRRSARGDPLANAVAEQHDLLHPDAQASRWRVTCAVTEKELRKRIRGDQRSTLAWSARPAAGLGLDGENKWSTLLCNHI